jgi:hypothetical protein
MKCDHKCKECGGQEQGNWMDDVSIKLALRELCHTCDFWHEKILIKDDPETARIDGTHYRVGQESVRGLFQGFGGHKFVIQFADGREVTTTNLWHQGPIPERFADRLPNNAVFLQQ